jgi:peptidoglycan DL-endopeptidase CwlO
MTERAPARHRADVRPSTPLTGITSTISAVVGDHASTIGRGGVVVAVSGGLVAGMGLPAAAATAGPGDTARTASVPLLSESAGAVGPAADALGSGTVSASSRARVSFEHSAFTAVAKGGVATATPASTTREIATISRSLARAAYKAARPVVPARRVPQQAPAPVTVPADDTTTTITASDDGTGDGGGSAVPAPPPVDGNASVVAIAMRYLGIAYRYGGTSPRGFDCSGFTQYVFKQVGISLPRTAQQQLNATTRIARSQAKAGDLVFFLSGGSAYHVGIYLGDGKMVDSPRSGKSVTVRSVYSANAVFARA